MSLFSLGRGRWGGGGGGRGFNVFKSRLIFVVVVVDCGLTSHSAIFQLYSDGTDVQFPNFDLLPGTHAMSS